MSNQKQRFPVGAIVCTLIAVPGYKHGDQVYGKLAKGAEGIVTGHTDDERAMFDFYGSVHTFNPLAQIKWRDAHIAELERQAEKREAELIRQVDCVIDLQAQLRAAQAVIDAAKTAVDFQPEEGSETDYATARRLWAELVIAVRKVQPAE